MLKAAAVAALSHDAQRMEMINQINAIPNLTWKAGVNPRFAGEPVGVSKSLCGVLEGNLENIKEGIAAGDIEYIADAPEGFAPPDDFDSATNWPMCSKVITDIRDQSNCGCCWAFGGASAASDRLCIATKGQSAVPLSAEAVCFCANNDGCSGGFLQATWSYVKKGSVTGGNQADTGPLGGGFCSEFSLPHCHHHGPQGQDPYPDEGTSGCPQQSSPKCPKACDSTAKPPHDQFAKDGYHFTGTIQNYGNEAAIQNAIMTLGPVETAFSVYQDFENYVSGIYKKTSSTYLGGHAVRIVGWGVDSGTKYWKVANSWNPFWGENGYFRIVRGTNECSIESQGMANGAGDWVGPTIFGGK
jgi:cathepsin B